VFRASGFQRDLLGLQGCSVFVSCPVDVNLSNHDLAVVNHKTLGDSRPARGVKSGRQHNGDVTVSFPVPRHPPAMSFTLLALQFATGFAQFDNHVSAVVLIPNTESGYAVY